jgi:hypothetical protein
MKEEYETKELSAKAKQILKRNEELRRKEWGLEPIPPLRNSTLAIFNAEMIEPVKQEVNGKMVQMFKYIIAAPSMYPDDTGEYELTVDAKTSEDIDAYLRKGLTMLEISTSRKGKDTRYRIQPLTP